VYKMSMSFVYHNLYNMDIQKLYNAPDIMIPISEHKMHNMIFQEMNPQFLVLYYTSPMPYFGHYISHK
jgi:hypothetical protein